MAMEWLLKSVDQNNNTNALFNIGYMFETGLGREQNYSEALEWYEMAAEQGDPEAQFTVGLFYEFGKGVEKDEEQAREWYWKAARCGHADAQKKIELLNKSTQQYYQYNTFNNRIIYSSSVISNNDSCHRSVSPLFMEITLIASVMNDMVRITNKSTALVFLALLFLL
ncbi:predicted protein [Naegleria gruberi]|uniref:Predicted protein n=1 Tax=Naegleria gruberi TaxID=5762 RepID=D2W4P2_NAEGR|nr:uncharacterized protein NAEGRDRAFT_76377 [Naegleria gruberi]EFC35961.1 predicted protein [Naegleria gruberi]|eukprot:XP_002668705.1 predicted protein [Naegleria gruberi strain NEG-M]